MTINNVINNIKEYFAKLYEKHSEYIIIIGLFVLFYYIFFHNIGSYFLMDADETRYVAMARDMFQSKDFLTLYLNGEYFFEKPPLYFWQECLSFAIFGKINEWTARFPVAFLGFIFSFVVYQTVKYWINRRFAVITSLIIATSLEFVILAKYAILDIVLTFYIGLSLISYFTTFFCHEKNKKYFWWAFYVFSALAIMAKGVPGFVVPFGTVFFISLATKRFKEIFKPINILPGIILFLLIVLPWHIAMLCKYKHLFFDEYIIKHHLHRFFNTENNEIGRKQPFYYYFIVVLWGFVPWIFSLIAVTVDKIKNWGKYQYFEKLKKLQFDNLDNTKKLLVLCWISIIWIMLFFSASSTKLATYILPVYYPLAIITALIWKDYLTTDKYSKPINISVRIVGWFCLISGILAMFTPLFLPAQINEVISHTRWFNLIVLIIFGSGCLLCLKYKKNMGIFILYVLFMTVVSAFSTCEFFKVDYKFGQQELIEISKYAKANDLTISAFGLSRKYSLLYYNDEIVDFEDKNEDKEIDLEEMKRDLAKKDNLVILKNKYFYQVDGKIEYDVFKKGRKYIILKEKNN